MNGGYIHTFTGHKFYPLNPDADLIDIEDIAHALAMSCRFTGHTRKFYSVAQHSVIVSQHCPNYPLTGLLHDASEAYLTDIPRPLKPKLNNYVEIEDHLQSVIAGKFDLPYPFPKEVHYIDNMILGDEARSLFPKFKWTDWGISNDLRFEGFGIEIDPWSPEESELHFLNRYRELVLAGDKDA